MKRIMTLLLAAGLVFGATGAAKAVDIKASGYWQFGFEWSNARSQVKGEQGDNFSALQRFRTQIDVIASENLKGVVFFEIGKAQWGKAKDGAALNNDGKVVKVRYSYVDWVVPETDLKVRMGLQPFNLPSFVSGSPILAEDGAGITLAYDFNENVGATLFWLRASNENSEDNDRRKDGTWEHDAMDVVGLTIPVKGDGFKVTPWGMYANVGRNSVGDIADSTLDAPASGLMPVGGADLWGPWGGLDDNLDDNGNAWWAGIGGELTLFSPFRVAAEFAYGSADFGSTTLGGKNFDAKRAGWYAALSAEYKLDMMTPGLIFWYASGDDDDPYDGSERMPVIYGSNTDWGVLSLAYDGIPFGRTGTYSVLSPDGSMTGTWGVVAQLKDISFVENLKHLLRVGYIRGTNDSEMVTGNDGFFAKYSDSSEPGGYLTEDDWAWEVDFITDYKIYEDLSLTFDVAYMRVDWDEDNWKKAGIDNLEKNYYRAGLYMKYSF